MNFYVLAACFAALVASGQSASVYPAGVDPNACPDYPFCGASSPADFPVPVVNGENVAPVLNTLPVETVFYQESQVVKSPAALPTHIINDEPVAPVLNTVPEQTRAHEEHLLISQQQQLEQLKQQQIIQFRIQEQEIEAARHFGRL